MKTYNIDQHDCTKGLEDGCDCDHITDTYNSVTGEHEEVISRSRSEDCGYDQEN